MKKLKHEGELFKAALLAGVQYAEGRGAVEFEATDSASDKALYVYRLLVHDKLIALIDAGDEEAVSRLTEEHFDAEQFYTDRIRPDQQVLVSLLQYSAEDSPAVRPS